MSTSVRQPETFINLSRAASHLGVPVKWLSAEADAGRVPYIRAGRGRLFNLESVRLVLISKAADSLRPQDEGSP